MLAVACLISDLANQQHKWNLGLGDLVCWHALSSPHLPRTDHMLVVNIITDIIIICLLITMISRLQMKLKDRISVAGIFALGFFVVVASST